MQAVLAERFGRRIVQAVHLACDLGFFADVHRFRRRRLHAIRQLVRLDPRIQFALVRPALRMVAVQVAQQIEQPALLRLADRLGPVQVQNRRTFALQQRALIRRGQKSRTPVLRAAHHALVVGQDHESRQVRIGRAQSIRQPRAQRRPARDDRARVHLAHRTDVIQPVGPAGADDGEIVRMLRDVRDTSRKPTARSARAAPTCASTA